MNLILPSSPPSYTHSPYPQISFLLADTAEMLTNRPHSTEVRRSLALTCFCMLSPCAPLSINIWIGLRTLVIDSSALHGLWDSPRFTSPQHLVSWWFFIVNALSFALYTFFKTLKPIFVCLINKHCIYYMAQLQSQIPNKTCCSKSKCCLQMRSPVWVESHFSKPHMGLNLPISANSSHQCSWIIYG